MIPALARVAPRRYAGSAMNGWKTRCLMLCAGAMAAPGCVHSSSEDARLGEVILLAAFEDGSRATAGDAGDHGVFDRAEWPEIMILAPNDQTTRLPRFTGAARYATDSERRRAEWPRALGAADRDLSEYPLFAEMLSEPIRAALDVVLIPFRAEAPTMRRYERSRLTAEEAAAAPTPGEEEH